MTTTQARRLLRLTRSVSKAKDYDQRNYCYCAMAHRDKLFGFENVSDELLGVNSDEWFEIFWNSGKEKWPTPTGPQKAAQIRAIVRRHHPGLVKAGRK